MFDRSSTFRNKDAIAVRVTLAGGEPFDAFVFVKLEERLSDLLNDPRSFLPIKRADGTVQMVAKTAIASIVELATLIGTASSTASGAEEPILRPAADQPHDVESARQKDDTAGANQDGFVGGDDEPPAQPQRAAAPGDESRYQTRAEQPHDRTAPKGEPPRGEPPREETSSRETSNDAAPPRPARARKPLDPYQLLRVPRTATLDEIKRAYKQRIKAVHPDTIASLDLDEDIARAVHLTAQRINQAYDRIMKDFQRAAEVHADSAETAETHPDGASHSGDDRQGAA